MGGQQVVRENEASIVLLPCGTDYCFFIWKFKWKKWLRWKKEKKKISIMFVLIFPASKCEHNKMDAFLEKYLVKFSYVVCLKRGESDNECHLKIEAFLVSCFQ